MRYFEDIPVKDSREAVNDAPDVFYILYRFILIFNDFNSELRLLELVAEDGKSDTEKVVPMPSAPSEKFHHR